MLSSHQCRISHRTNANPPTLSTIQRQTGFCQTVRRWSRPSRRTIGLVNDRRAIPSDRYLLAGVDGLAIRQLLGTAHWGAVRRLCHYVDIRLVHPIPDRCF